MSYLKFLDLEIPAGQKTPRFSVVTTGPIVLGQVRFYPQWRKFCFFPEELTLFDEACLKDIAEFCHNQNIVRREGL